MKRRMTDVPEKFVRGDSKAGNRAEEKLLRKIEKGSGVSKASAIRIAKSQGLMKQAGAHLVLTKKGQGK